MLYFDIELQCIVAANALLVNKHRIILKFQNASLSSVDSDSSRSR